MRENFTKSSAKSFVIFACLRKQIVAKKTYIFVSTLFWIRYEVREKFSPVLLLIRVVVAFLRYSVGECLQPLALQRKWLKECEIYSFAKNILSTPRRVRIRKCLRNGILPKHLKFSLIILNFTSIMLKYVISFTVALYLKKRLQRTS